MLQERTDNYQLSYQSALPGDFRSLEITIHAYWMVLWRGLIIYVYWVFFVWNCNAVVGYDNT